MPGHVYLVGAGPGDPGLISVRGVECLRRADLVLYDYLANAQLLEYAPAAEQICLGRHGHGKISSQDEINARMVQAAREGLTVVRLKGGDPSVFGRMSEEAHALASAGVPFEIVPGITAALAAASYAGIPLTDRDRASAVTLVTGHEGNLKEADAVDYRAVAGLPGTLVFYMGVTTSPQWTQALIDAGKPADTPAVIVRRCSWPNQMTVRCKLSEVPGVLDQSRPDRIRPPAVVIIGEIAAIDETLNWFTHRPLFGTCVLVTRPRQQATDLRTPLAELGADVLLQPAIEIRPPADWKPLDDALARLADFEWIVFSSSNGVQSFLGRLCNSGDLRQLGSAKLAAIGPGTADELARWRLRADLVPDEYRAERLVEALAALGPSDSGGRCLLIRASRGREVLAEGLTAAGFAVEQVVAYESADVATPDADVLEGLEAGEIDWITVTSSAIARSLAALFGPSLSNARLVSISPVTSATLRELGYEPAAEATEYTMAGVVDALVAAAGH